MQQFIQTYYDVLRYVVAFRVCRWRGRGGWCGCWTFRGIGCSVPLGAQGLILGPPTQPYPPGDGKVGPRAGGTWTTLRGQSAQGEGRGSVGGGEGRRE